VKRVHEGGEGGVQDVVAQLALGGERRKGCGRGEGVGRSYRCEIVSEEGGEEGRKEGRKRRERRVVSKMVRKEGKKGGRKEEERRERKEGKREGGKKGRKESGTACPRWGKGE
jgi:hypothetical protein